MTGHIPHHARLIEYVFNLGAKDRRACVTLPEDITPEEAARLARIIQTLPMEETA